MKARAANPGRFPAIDPAHNADHTRELSGFLPWTITGYFEKLQSGFALLNALEKFGGASAEIRGRLLNIYCLSGKAK